MCRCLACRHPYHRGLGIILDGSIPKMPEGFRVDHLLQSFEANGCEVEVGTLRISSAGRARKFWKMADR